MIPRPAEESMMCSYGLLAPSRLAARARHWLVGAACAGLLLPAAQAGAQPAGPAQPSHPAVDSIFRGWDRAAEPGVAVAVVRGDSVLHVGGYGMADLEQGVPITPRTRFDVASVSKHFTAFAAANLIEEGRLDPDDRFRNHFPEFPAFTSPVRVEHLVHHTSGIRDWVELFAIAGWRFDDVIGVPDILTLARNQRKLNFEPGAQYRYSNTAYNLLAKLVGRVSGDALPAYLEANVFGPLGMEDTHSHSNHRHVVPQRARSYRPSDTAPGGFELLVNNTTAVGSSSIFTTARDMGRWLANYYGREVGDDAVWRRMHRREILNSGDTIDYAYGLSHDTYGGYETIGHGGSWRGYRSQILWVRGPELGVAVLGNRTDSRPDSLAREVVRAVADVAEEDVEEEPAGEDEEAAGREEPEERLPESPVPLEEYEGQYYSPELGTAYRLVVREGELVATHRQVDDQVLRPEEEDVFTTEGVRGPLTLSFDRDGAGDVSGYELAGRRFSGVVFRRLSLDGP